MANLAALASDENNQEFVGARNPDDLCTVRFYEHPLKNEFKSEQEGRPIFDTIVFIEIMTPGQRELNIVQRPKYPQDEVRFPRQWAYYKNTHSEDPMQQGTPLSQWPLLNVGMVEMLKALKFFSVDQIAFASDAQIDTIGMLAGMAPFSLRQKAKAYLEVARDSSAVSKKDAELKERDDKIAALEAKLNALAEKVGSPETPTLAKPEKKNKGMSEENRKAAADRMRKRQADKKAAREAKSA